MNVFLDIALFAIGVLLLYIAIFLYESEERGFQNVLDDWWIRLDDYRGSLLSRHTMFMRQVSRLASAGFDKLFGRKLVSIQSTSASACYSLASVGLLAFMVTLIFHELQDPLYVDRFGGRSIILALTAIWCIASICLGTFVPAITRTIVLLLGALLMALLGLIIPKDSWVHMWVGNPADSFDPSFWSALLVAITSDVAFIAITRRLLKWIYNLDMFMKTIGVVLFNCILAFVLFYIPAYLAFHFTDGGTHFPYAGLFFHTLSYMNLTVLIPALVFVVLALLMLIHRLLWPLLLRPVYAVAKLGVVRRRKLFGSLGVALITLAVSDLEKPIKLIVKALT